MVRLLSQKTVVLITVRLCVRDSYGPDFTLYLDLFLFLRSLRTFIALKMLFWGTFVSNGPLAQSVERGANNAKVVFSRLIRIRFYFIFGFVSLFKKFAYIHCLKNVDLLYVSVKWSVSSVGRSVVLIMVKSCVRDTYGPHFAFYLDYFLFLG